MSDRERLFSAFEKNKARTSRSSDRRRDWFPIALSIASLLISATTAYFNFFLHVDDVRALPAATGFILRQRDNKIVLAGNPRVAFINSGNRVAAILYFSMNIRRLETGAQPKCVKDDKITFPQAEQIDNPPFVVKANDIVVMTPKVRGSGDEDEALLYGSKKPPAPGQLLICMLANLITPDKNVWIVEFPAYLVEINKSLEVTSALINEEPIALRRSRTIY